MEGQVITKEKLISIRNDELTKHEDGPGCLFGTRVVKLKKVDEAGCNWSALGLMCSGVSVDVASELCSRLSQML
jgi:hypothetical protein